jgi:hypothetical protein
VKHHYRKVWHPWRRNRVGLGAFYYVHRHAGYHRAIRTIGELRRNDADHHDRELRVLGCRPRACRGSKYLDAWNDPPLRRNYKKGWKDYTRHRKQWMSGADPAPSDRWR